jgi:hypothetical protein
MAVRCARAKGRARRGGRAHILHPASSFVVIITKVVVVVIKVLHTRGHRLEQRRDGVQPWACVAARVW